MHLFRSLSPFRDFDQIWNDICKCSYIIYISVCHLVKHFHANKLSSVSDEFGSTLHNYKLCTEFLPYCESKKLRNNNKIHIHFLA